MPFTTPIRLQCPTDESGCWKTLEPLNFWSEKKQKNYVVPKDFETDLASVPRLPVIFRLVGGRAPAAAVVHDWLYRNGVKFKRIKTRIEADQIFLEAMLDTHVPDVYARLMYAGVRAGGRQFFQDTAH